MRSKLFISMVSASLLVSSILTGASSVTNVYSINNESEGTYKVTDEILKNSISSINLSSSKVNYNLFNNYKNIKDESTEVSWLLERDILTKDINLNCSRYKVDWSLDNTIYHESNQGVTKSDYISAMAKIFYGVEKSRGIVINTKASSIYGNDSGISSLHKFYNVEGDYGVYYTPNVYEIYFTKMLDKGMIHIGDFKDINFIKDYKNYTSSTVPEWSNLNNSYKTSSSDLNFGNKLGYSTQATYSSGNLSITHSKPDYFVNENIDTIEALKLLEKLLRQEERNMTETESKIIMYKYGADYLLNLDQDSRSTVMYLISLGILNFEDKEEFSHLFSCLDSETFIKLLYRTANKSARFDFSKVQLTDSDNYWLNKGMYASNVNMINSDFSDMPGSVELYDNSQVSDEDSVVKHRGIVFADTNQNTYKVTRFYKQGIDYKYRGVLVENSSEFKALDDVVDYYHSYGASQYNKATYKITATSPESAAALVDNRTVAITNNSALVAKIPAVVSVADDSGNNRRYYIPKAFLDDNISSFDISYLDDKLLYNNKTGARAVLSEENKVALIGNEICESPNPVIKGYESETYYDLDIIAKLMTHATLKYIQGMGGDLYLSPEIKNAKVKTITNGLNQQTDKAYTVDIDHVRQDGKVVDREHEANFVNKSFFSLVHTTNSLDYMYKNVGKSEKSGYPIYMVVNWNYVIPNNNNAMNSSISAEFDKFNSNKNPSVSEMSNFLNTRPSETVMQKWWDSNIGLSNAICNFMYNSSGLYYFKSGYMAPSVTILCQDHLEDSEVSAITDKWKFSSDYGAKFFGDTQQPVKSLFTGGNDIYGQLCNSRRFDVLEGFRLNYVSDVDVVEFGDFILDKNNTLYKSYGKGGPLCETRLSDSTDGNLVLNDRSEQQDDTIQLYGNYTLNGEKYFCSGITAVGFSYTYQLTKSDYLTGTAYMEDDDSGLNWKNDSYQSILDVTTKLSGVSQSDKYFSIPNSAEWRARCVGRAPVIPIENDPILGYPQENAFYLGFFEPFRWRDREEDPIANGGISVVKVDKDDKDNFRTTVYEYGEYKSYYSMGGERLYPNIFINRFAWKSKEDGSLYKSDQSPYLVRPNLRNVGVTSAVIDSIMSSSYGYVTTDKLPNNSKATIGGINFTKKGVDLVSAPVTGANLCSDLIGQINNSTSVMSALSKLFDGEFIVCEGKDRDSITKSPNTVNQALCDYIIKDSKGLPIIGIGDSDTTNIDRTLIRRGSTYLLLNKDGKTSEYYEGDSFNAVVFSAQFSSSLLFRPVDKDKNEWALINVCNTQADGYLSSVPFFTEKLGYSWDDSVYNRMIKAKYESPDGAEGLFSEMELWFAKMHATDWYTWLRMILLIASCYLWVVNYVVYVAKKLVPGLMHILDLIHHPNGEGSNGIDLIKILTLGLKSLDGEEKFTTTFGVGVLLTLIIVAIELLM